MQAQLGQALPRGESEIFQSEVGLLSRWNFCGVCAERRDVKSEDESSNRTDRFPDHGHAPATRGARSVRTRPRVYARTSRSVAIDAELRASIRRMLWRLRSACGSQLRQQQRNGPLRVTAADCFQRQL